MYSPCKLTKSVVWLEMFLEIIQIWFLNVACMRVTLGILQRSFPRNLRVRCKNLNYSQPPKSLGCFSPILQIILHGRSGSKEEKKSARGHAANWSHSYFLMRQGQPCWSLQTAAPNTCFFLTLHREGCSLTVELNSLQVSEETTSSLIIKPSEPQPGWYLYYRTTWGGWPDLALALLPEQR